MACSNCGTLNDCNCDPCAVPGVNCGDCPPFVPVPGPTGPVGPQGPSGAAGSNGVNAFTTLGAQFAQPLVGANIVATVANSTWMAATQTVYVSTGGYYLVISTPTSTSVTLQNTGATGNAAPAAIVANGSKVSPAGAEGSPPVSPLAIADGGTGQSNAINAFGALSPLTTTGDILAFSGGANVRIAPGTSGYVWTSNGAGVLPTYQLNAPSAGDITGTLPILHGGTGGTTASAARTNLAVPGLADSNTFTNSNLHTVTGSQFFQVNAGNGTFRMATTAGVITACYWQNTTTGATIDLVNSRFSGPWVQLQKGTSIASGATYTITTEETIVSTRSASGTQTITLPTGTANRIVRIVDAGGNASSNNITVSPAGGETIMGSASAIISLNYGTLSLLFVASTMDWVPLP